MPDKSLLYFVCLPVVIFGIIPENQPLEIKQGGWCLDHKWADDPDHLVLFACHGGENQKFTWRQDEETWDYFHLISNLADKCVGFSDSDLDASGVPKNKAVALFKHCQEDDPLIRWKYLYGTQQLQLSAHPTKCLDFSAGMSSRLFVAYDCKVDQGHFELRNQQFEFEQIKWDKIRPGMPVQIQQMTGSFTDWLGHCLDQSLDQKTADQLILYACKRAENQLFHWSTTSEVAKRKEKLHLNHLVSSKDGKCVAAGSEPVPSAGAPLVLKECTDHDKTIRWRYAHGLQQVKLEKWPKLCMSIVDSDTNRMGVAECKLDGRGMALPHQHFRSLDMGEKPIPEHVPLTIEQNGWCLDQKYDSSPDQAILYSCSGATNQQWVWRGSSTLGYHFLVSNLDDRCLGFSTSGMNASGRPQVGSKIDFKTCKSDDDSIKWVYDYASQQLKLKTWKDLCLEYSDSIKSFVASVCKFEVWAFGFNAYKQRFQVSASTGQKKLPVRLPVVIKTVGMMAQQCLDRPPQTDSLSQFPCKFQLAALSVNQEFMWRGNVSWHYSQLVSNVDMKCLAAKQAAPESTVSFTDCTDSNPLARWIYSSGKSFIKLADHSHLCLEFNGQTYVIGTCKFDTWGMADSRQRLEVRSLGFHEIKEDTPQLVRQNSWCLDRPYKDSGELGLYACGGGDNQKFVWYNLLTWEYHYFISHVDNKCLGVQGTGQPTAGSPVSFKPCSENDQTIRWIYSYGLSQLKLSVWPHLCLDFDESKRAFTVKACTFLDGSSGGGLWPANNQRIEFPHVFPEPKEKKKPHGVHVSFGRRRRSGVHVSFGMRRRKFLRLDEVHSDDSEEESMKYKLEDATERFMFPDLSRDKAGHEDHNEEDRAIEGAKPTAATLGIGLVLSLNLLVLVVVAARARSHRSAESYRQVLNLQQEQ